MPPSASDAAPASFSAEDQALGMNRDITRRDVLNGLAYSAAALGLQSLMPWAHAQAQGTLAPEGTPPTAQAGVFTGQTEDSYRVMHAMRRGKQPTAPAASTGERFDLVVVGAGLSGLAAAHEFRRIKPQAKVLLLDPMDDVGGHAKRNEFDVDGHHLIGYGGSEALQTPSQFSPAVRQMLRDIGIQAKRFEEFYDQEWFTRQGMDGSVVYFDSAVWGRAVTVQMSDKAADWVPQTPLSAQAQADLIGLLEAPQDYLPGLSAAQKRDRLAELTYRQFLLEVVKAHEDVARFYRDSTRDYFGAGTDAISALDAWAIGLPGFAAMNLGDTLDRRLNATARLVAADPDDYIYHFPDGNATVARAFISRLIPRAMPARDMVDIALNNLDYRQLDVAGEPVRLRLNSTVVKVRHLGHPKQATMTEVTYADPQGHLQAVVADRVVLACWHRVIPFLTDELPAEQVSALNDQVKVPMVYATVALHNSRAFQRLGLSEWSAPGSGWMTNFLDYPVSLGDYRYARNADEPILLHMVHVPGGTLGADARTQFNEGRRQMIRTSFADYERQIRRQLNEVLGSGGFDAARDIAALTINRWGHGYTYEYGRPDDTFWPEGPLPAVTARQGWGRIAIANADSGANAYAHTALEQGIRASREVLGIRFGPRIVPFPGPPESELKFG